MDEITQQNAALAEQTSAASVSMSEQATEMKNLLGFFMLSEDANTQTTAVQSGGDRRAAARPWGGGAKRVNTVDFASARSKHLAWKSRLRNFLDGKEALTQSQAVSHRDCDLGKWLYSEGMEKYGHIGEMQKLEQQHKEMHGLIGDIIRQQEAGNTDQAEASYSQVTSLSAQVVDHLSSIEKQVKSGAGTAGPQKVVAAGVSSAAISNSDDWEEF
jgi:methyl-accepting chemotaxis protein